MKKHASRGKGVKRPGSGRTKGANSFCLIELGELNRRFADPKTKIQIGRLWAQGNEFTNVISMDAKSLQGKIEGTTAVTEIDSKEVEL